MYLQKCTQLNPGRGWPFKVFMHRVKGPGCSTHTTTSYCMQNFWEECNPDWVSFLWMWAIPWEGFSHVPPAGNIPTVGEMSALVLKINVGAYNNVHCIFFHDSRKKIKGILRRQFTDLWNRKMFKNCQFCPSERTKSVPNYPPPSVNWIHTTKCDLGIEESEILGNNLR